MLTCGLIGLPGCGKSTLFALLTGVSGASGFGGTGEVRRVATVPDPRIDALSRDFEPKKTTYAQIEMVDIPGLVPGEKSRAAHFLDAVRGSDALIFVLRGFIAPGQPEPNPSNELATLEAELILADLVMVENRMARLESEGKGGVSRKDQPLYSVLGRIEEHLAEGLPFSDLELDPSELELLAHTAFLSSKPALWAINVSESDLATAAAKTGLATLSKERGVPLVTISAQVEKEIAELDQADAEVFLADLGLTEPGTARMARAVYERLGLISFLTSGPDEVRAWTIRGGTKAKEAAGKIHSDIERGFIRAEVVAYADYQAAAEATPASGAAPSKGGKGGTSLGDRVMVTAKEKALMRLEGKDYEVKDGDIINFRFNV